VRLVILISNISGGIFRRLPTPGLLIVVGSATVPRGGLFDVPLASLTLFGSAVHLPWTVITLDHDARCGFRSVCSPDFICGALALFVTLFTYRFGYATMVTSYHWDRRVAACCRHTAFRHLPARFVKHMRGWTTYWRLYACCALATARWRVYNASRNELMVLYCRATPCRRRCAIFACMRTTRSPVCRLLHITAVLLFLALTLPVWFSSATHNAPPTNSYWFWRRTSQHRLRYLPGHFPSYHWRHGWGSLGLTTRFAVHCVRRTMRARIRFAINTLRQRRSAGAAHARDA